MRYLTMEHREVGGKTDNQAALTFASERQGVASWLAAPASMGSLEFVSPDASMVTSAVIKNPRSILEELFQMIGAGDQNFSQHWRTSNRRAGSASWTTSLRRSAAKSPWRSTGPSFQLRAGN